MAGSTNGKTDEAIIQEMEASYRRSAKRKIGLQGIGVLVVAVAVLVGLGAIWLHQTQGRSEAAADQKVNDEQVYGQSGNNATAGRVGGVTITRLKLRATPGGTEITFDLNNAGSLVQLTKLTVDGQPARLRQPGQTTAQPLPARGLPVAASSQQAYRLGGKVFVVSTGTKAVAGRKVPVQLYFRPLGPVSIITSVSQG